MIDLTYRPVQLGPVDLRASYIATAIGLENRGGESLGVRFLRLPPIWISGRVVYGAA